MNTMRLLSSLAFAFALILTSCGSKTEEKVNVEEKPLVKIENVVEEDVPQIANFSATVQAFKTNNITTSTPNRIKKILVDVGMPVSAGQTVVILDDVNINQMKLRLENYKREYDRAVELLKIGGGTQQSVDQLATEYEAYKRSYSNMLENTVLVSPISGVVTARNFDNGDMTNQTPILTIEQIKPVKIIVNVSEQDFTKIYKGMEVDVNLDVYPNETFKGKVALIHPTVDATTRTFAVEINIVNDNNKVRPGMFARVDINYGTKQHVVVPDNAIVKQSGSGNKYVYIYKDGKVYFKQVELGQRLENRYELLSGVPNNSQIVVTGQSRLADGIAVELARDAQPAK